MSAIHDVIIVRSPEAARESLRPERDFARVKAPTANMAERSLVLESQRAGETVVVFSIGTVTPPAATAYKPAPQFYGSAAHGA